MQSTSLTNGLGPLSAPTAHGTTSGEGAASVPPSPQCTTPWAQLCTHTLPPHPHLCTDIKMKEQSVEDMMKGRKVFQPPRFMTAPQAAKQLLTVIQRRRDQGSPFTGVCVRVCVCVLIWCIYAVSCAAHSLCTCSPLPHYTLRCHGEVGCRRPGHCALSPVGHVGGGAWPSPPLPGGGGPHPPAGTGDARTLHKAHLAHCSGRADLVCQDRHTHCLCME